MSGLKEFDTRDLSVLRAEVEAFRMQEESALEKMGLAELEAHLSLAQRAGVTEEYLDMVYAHSLDAAVEEKSICYSDVGFEVSGGGKGVSLNLKREQCTDKALYDEFVGFQDKLQKIKNDFGHNRITKEVAKQMREDIATRKSEIIKTLQENYVREHSSNSELTLKQLKRQQKQTEAKAKKAVAAVTDLAGSILEQGKTLNRAASSGKVAAEYVKNNLGPMPESEEAKQEKADKLAEKRRWDALSPQEQEAEKERKKKAKTDAAAAKAAANKADKKAARDAEKQKEKEANKVAHAQKAVQDAEEKYDVVADKLAAAKEAEQKAKDKLTELTTKYKDTADEVKAARIEVATAKLKEASLKTQKARSARDAAMKEHEKAEHALREALQEGDAENTAGDEEKTEEDAHRSEREDTDLEDM